MINNKKMPEAVEVFMIAQELQVRVAGLEFENVKISSQYKQKNVELLNCPNSIKEVISYGKKLIIKCQDVNIILSLGMTCRCQYEKNKHTHITIKFKEFNLYFNDARRIGSQIEIVHNKELDQYLTKLGPPILNFALKDPEEWMDSKTWRNVFKTKLLKRNIWQILMDQKILAGLGNYLTIDILYASKISPLRLGNTITKKELDIIRIKTHEILRISHAHGGFTIKDYITLNGKKGSYPPLIYGRKEDDLGNIVTRVKMGGRTVQYVKTIQV